MAIGIVITGVQDLPLVQWASMLARGRDEGLVLFWVQQRRGEGARESSRTTPIPELLQATCNELDEGPFRLVVEKFAENQVGVQLDEDSPQLPLEVVSIVAQQLPEAITQEVESSRIKSLLLPRPAEVRCESSDFKFFEYLLGHVSCEVILLTPGTGEVDSSLGVVVPVGQGPHTGTCLRLARELTGVTGADVTAVLVEPELDEVAPQVGAKLLSQIVESTVGRLPDRVTQRVLLADDVVDGLCQQLDTSHGLVLLGAGRMGVVRRFRSQSIGERLIQVRPSATVAVVQSAIPATSQLVRQVESCVRATVPQLTRDRRVSLVERIQTSSQWDFDFIALISLSTLIAAGGLIQNSAAVVIGAMLVAPLMTPLLGTGLSLVQGNVVLMGGTLSTVAKGFLLALLLGWLVGLMVPGAGVSEEMQARGSPKVLDLGVAFISGVAAAYASGRPSLLSALPGVAIAASLVPPIATSGIAAWLACQSSDLHALRAHLSLCLGASMLFLTNIVAIVLGTAVAFWAVGIRGTHQYGPRGARTVYAMILFSLLAVGLGAYETWSAHLPWGLRQEVSELLNEQNATCEKVVRDRQLPGVEITIGAAEPLEGNHIQRLKQLVQQRLGSDARIRVRTSLSEVR